jgi:2-polyprenyl-3-methyl-5-hydroxy-6-metoxy-1,4-benzoquinol methylase
VTQCYLCGSAMTRVIRDHLRSGVRRNVLKCDACGLDFLEPQDKDLRAYYATEYRKEYSPRPEEAAESQTIFDVYRPLQQERIERLRPYLPGAAGRVLDVGCSAGHFLHAVREFVGQCVGIEFNLANVAFVREKLGFEAHAVPVEETSLAERSFDLITCFHALEHMPDPRAFLKTVRRYLKPGGRVYVEVPNVEDALLSVYRSEPYADFWYREPHLFNFSPATFRTLMEQAGYRGDLLPVQRYSFLNHLHWAQVGKPQGSAEVAMPTPILVSDERAPASARNRLNAWMARVDTEYRRILMETGVSESIGFVGQAA